VTYYGLNLRLTTAPPFLEGAVTIRGICRAAAPRFLVLDLSENMRIDSVRVGGSAAAVTQQPSAFTVSLDSGFRPNDIILLEIFYRGVPQASGLGSFVFSSHAGTPWVWSLSEPYGARDWWPCKDQPGDKADSVDITVTCDSAFSVGSNGRLLSVQNNPGGTRTTRWQERYPIATYLVSVAVTNYAHFSNWFHYSPSDSMEVLNYVLPESLSSARALLPNAVDGLRRFSGLFGLYPFVNEKYGHSQFSGGGMEHQTMTSITGFDEEMVIHELAHQWFGDMITCRSWQHLWLNEGFATYCTALYEELKYGTGAYQTFMALRMDQARGAAGSVFVEDTSNVRNLFNSGRVYSKGAAVLHMLRHVLGDSVFFRSIKGYANDPRLKYGTATTEDLKRNCEQTSGKDLGYFFDEWIYGENYPHYSYGWNVTGTSGRKVVRLSITQSTGTSNPVYFKMPVDFRMAAQGWDSTITLFNDAPEQVFSFTVPVVIESLQLDPANWILKGAVELPLVPEPSEFHLFQNYPNPFNISTHVQYSVPHRATVSLIIFDLQGRRVATLVSGTRNVGTYSAVWDAAGMPSGVYLCRMEATGATIPHVVFRDERKLLLVK
jgi:aminopeptidase N